MIDSPGINNAIRAACYSCCPHLGICLPLLIVNLTNLTDLTNLINLTEGDSVIQDRLPNL